MVAATVLEEGIGSWCRGGSVQQGLLEELLLGCLLLFGEMGRGYCCFCCNGGLRSGLLGMGERRGGKVGRELELGKGSEGEEVLGEL